tara:strand:- start:34678 stop:35559 length:882 start_codon:yes stop_codon:yes gene_type:complete
MTSTIQTSDRADERQSDSVDLLMTELRDRCGLKREAVLERKVASLVRQQNVKDLRCRLDDLLGRPTHDPRWLSFVDAVTVHETYFFRDPNQLDVLSASLLPELIARKREEGDRGLSIWSAGCSSGEEAYTVAILVQDALNEAGEDLAAWNLRLLGSDVSRAMVSIAEKAVYGGPGLDAFRQLPPGRDVWFERLPDDAHRRRVRAGLRVVVRFEQHNLMDDLPPVRDVDLALCRNVFIYLDADAQRRAVQVLHKALKSEGLLLLGVTDRLEEGSGFARAATGTAVVYVKNGSSQ